MRFRQAPILQSIMLGNALSEKLWQSHLVNIVLVVAADRPFATFSSLFAQPFCRLLTIFWK